MVDGKRYFLVGIGGSGMMPLAMILAGRGAQVEGSDRSLDAGRVPAKFDALRALGIRLHPQDGSGIVSAEQVVVASAAVEDSVPDIVRATALGCTRMTRAELNATLFNAATVSIGVAGTSGKSTVTGMIAWILHALGREPTVMNGAVMINFVSPGAPFASALVGKGAPGKHHPVEDGDPGVTRYSDVFVSEVDESDGSIALYRPTVAVLNNVSRDHKELDELRGLFGGFIACGACAVVNADDTEAAAILAERDPKLALTFGIDSRPSPQRLVAANIVEEPFAVSFEVIDGMMPVGRVRLRVPGRHNVANALAALTACRAAAIATDAELITALEGYAGLSRRFELVGEANGVAVIDDFGHNPDKITATLQTLRAFPGRLLLLFQPHGYGPLRQLCAELAEAFAQGMAPGDLLVLPDPAYFGGTVTREVGSDDLASDIAALGRDARHVEDRETAAALLVEAARPGDRIVVMGARDDTLGQLARRMVEGLATRARS